MEFLIVLTVLVFMPLTVFYGIRMLRESKYRAMQGQSETSGDTMRRSELESLIHDAVLDATEPLVARIDELERELLLGDDRESRLAPSVLAEVFEDDADEERETSGRTRERA